jgi:protocatechuate 3,4-dioxygenase beta subunit
MDMKTLTFIALILLTGISACSQNGGQSKRNDSDKEVGGGCEGCEAIFEFGSRQLTWTDTLPDFSEAGEKLEISGTIYKQDGRTPAKDVILYIYHTDRSGQYPHKGNEEGWAERHGYLRGWIRTNADGKYKFHTLKPGAYPEGGNPAHVHATIKEPGVKEYWIDEFLFEGDVYLTDRVRSSLRNRGGNGIIKTKKDESGTLVMKRDIILGLNVPGYE